MGNLNNLDMRDLLLKFRNEIVSRSRVVENNDLINQIELEIDKIT